MGLGGGGGGGALEKSAHCEVDLTFFFSNCVFFSFCWIAMCVCVFVSVCVYMCVCGCALKTVYQNKCVTVRTCAGILIHLCVCVCVQQQCVCFLPIRHSMTGHVVKQLAGLFMDQQLWEEISKYQLDTHKQKEKESGTNFEC